MNLSAPQRAIAAGMTDDVAELLSNNRDVFGEIQQDGRRPIRPTPKPPTTPPPDAPTAPATAPPAREETVPAPPATTLAAVPKQHASMIDLDQDAMALDSLGVRFRAPKGAILTKPITGAMPIYTVDDSQDPTRFHMQIQTLVSELADPTPSSQIAEYLASLKKRNENFTVLLNAPWVHSTARGHYLLTRTDLGGGVIAIQGWLVLQTGPYDFVVFSLLSSELEFQNIRPTLEASFRTIEFGDLERIAAARVARLRKGSEWLASLTPKLLESVCTNEPRLYRVWHADPHGKEQEIGYYRVTVMAGKMADASGEQPPAKSDNPTGMLVLLQGRTIIDASTSRFADTEARFWTSWDRGSEAWTSRVTERGGTLSEKSFAQTGIRSPSGVGNPRQTLKVINGNAQSRTRDEQEWIVPTGLYLSQGETVIIGELLPRAEGQAPLNIACYAFNPQSMTMPQRIDTWTRTSEGHWMLLTQPALDEPADIAWHDSKGRRIRRTEPDGISTELCLPRQLQQIWSDRGLSTR
ncbi:MAG: hypothetical protein EXS15_06355 [Phycisphaerales bacterium]|nr:hypothetical protein [Phycisphaerales bacterium]